MTTLDNTRSDLSNEEFAGARPPLFPETNRGVQSAISPEERQADEDRSSAWRAVMASHLL
ncbi:hypothetical protein [Methylopila sp. M107]|uniref:hypothetical protein n=1 Tax=Methylopila sp. M107 TaxID=1101190 RepID=UPI00037C3854|nr:hypothetical protein [Methylopila sp. M107]